MTSCCGELANAARSSTGSRADLYGELLQPVQDELARRIAAFADARLDVELNGHVTFVEFRPGDEGGWRYDASCHCGWRSDVEDQATAHLLATEHAEATGGATMTSELDQELYPEP